MEQVENGDDIMAVVKQGTATKIRIMNKVIRKNFNEKRQF